MSMTAASRRPPTFVWAIWGLTVVVSLTALVMMIVNREIPLLVAWGARWTMETWALAFGTVGAVVSWRARGNAIGALLLAAGATAATHGLVTEIGLAASGAGLGVLVHWFVNWWWIPIIACMSIALVLFPTGRPSSPFWRAWVAVIAVTGVLHILAVAFLQQTVPAVGSSFPNPVAPAALAGFEWAVVPAVVAFQLATVIGIGSLFARRGGGQVARQQLRWLRFAAASVMALVLIVELGGQLGFVGVATYRTGTYLVALSIVFVPVAIGIAVLRYRLYEIDRIVSRTVGYAIVTAILGLAYVATVLSFQGLFTSQTGDVPDLVVAGATLALAAAFIPLRRRIQVAVDRRFNRRTYDASRLLESFGSRLREETDLGELSSQVSATAAEIVEPTTVALWLSPRR